MSRPRKWLLALLPLGLCAAFLFLRTIILNKPRPPFELSFWYWHSPFKLSPSQTKDLKALGVTKLFVRTGTFSSDGTNFVLTLPQTYQSDTKGFQIHQVFNFDAGIVQHFASYDLHRIAGQIATRVDSQVAKAERQGLVIAGVQFDFDCPTRLLTRYAQLIQLVRPQLKEPRLTFSATGLMSWLGSEGVTELSRQVDFLVPQAYEGTIGWTAETMRPVSDEADFRRRIGRADGLACPFYIGVPAYGHGFLFDSQDRLAAVYRNLDPIEAMRHPSFKLTAAYPADRLGQAANDVRDSTGEEILKFKAVQSALDGKGRGDVLAFTVPTPQLLAKMLKAVRETRSSECLGAIIYRMPESDSTLTLPWQSLMTCLRGQTLPPKLKVKLVSTRNSFQAIESPSSAGNAPIDLNLEIENLGGPTFLGPDAATVDIQWNTPGLDDVNRGDMDSVQVGISATDGLQYSSPARANEVLFRKVHLKAGERLSVGPIRLLSSEPPRVTVHWKVRAANGFQIVEGGQSLSR